MGDDSRIEVGVDYALSSEEGGQLLEKANDLSRLAVLRVVERGDRGTSARQDKNFKAMDLALRELARLMREYDRQVVVGDRSSPPSAELQSVVAKLKDLQKWVLAAVTDARSKLDTERGYLDIEPVVSDSVDQISQAVRSVLDRYSDYGGQLLGFEKPSSLAPTQLPTTFRAAIARFNSRHDLLPTRDASLLLDVEGGVWIWVKPMYRGPAFIAPRGRGPSRIPGTVRCRIQGPVLVPVIWVRAGDDKGRDPKIGLTVTIHPPNGQGLADFVRWRPPADSFIWLGSDPSSHATTTAVEQWVDYDPRALEAFTPVVDLFLSYRIPEALATLELLQLQLPGRTAEVEGQLFSELRTMAMDEDLLETQTVETLMHL